MVMPAPAFGVEVTASVRGAGAVIRTLSSNMSRLVWVTVLDTSVNFSVVVGLSAVNW